MRQIIPAPAGLEAKFNYSTMVYVHPFYYSAGMIAIDPKTSELVSGSPSIETKRILQNLDLVLQSINLESEHIINAKIYTTKMEDFGEINKVWDEYFDKTAPPSRTSVGVAALPLKACVEMDFVFMNPHPNPSTFDK